MVYGAAATGSVTAALWADRPRHRRGDEALLIRLSIKKAIL